MFTILSNKREILMSKLKQGFKFSLNNKRQECYKLISVTSKTVGIYRYICNRGIYEEIELKQILSWFKSNHLDFIN